MSITQILFLSCVFLGAVFVILAIQSFIRPDRTQDRLKQLVSKEDRDNPQSRFVETVVSFTAPISKLSAPETGFERSAVQTRLVHAGYRMPNAASIFFGLKSALTLGLPLIALACLEISGNSFSTNTVVLILLVFAAAGYYGPNIFLSQRIAERQLDILKSFPDALDLMIVCVEAGLGTEAAMIRVSEDLEHKSPLLSDELRIVNLELRAGSDRERALRNLALRTGVEEVEGFVSMIIQAERFGTSVATSLRIQSELLRTRQRQRAEEQAAKIGLKLLMPLIFCIFPSLMLVLLGPAFLQLIRGLSSLGN